MCKSYDSFEVSSTRFIFFDNYDIRDSKLLSILKWNSLGSLILVTNNIKMRERIESPVGEQHITLSWYFAQWLSWWEEHITGSNGLTDPQSSNPYVKWEL